MGASYDGANLASYLCRGNCFGPCNGFGAEGASAPCNGYSTGIFALYPSREITEYFTGLCFSSCILRGLPSWSTRYTFTFRYVPSFFWFVGRYVSTYWLRIDSLICEKISGSAPWNTGANHIPPVISANVRISLSAWR